MGLIPLDKLEFAQWQTFLLVFFVLLEVYNLIVKTIQNHRSESQIKNSPMKALEDRVDALEKENREQTRRIEALERKDDEHQIESRLILRGMLALTRHGVDGNNIQGLKDYQSELQEYLVGK